MLQTIVVLGTVSTEKDLGRTMRGTVPHMNMLDAGGAVAPFLTKVCPKFACNFSLSYPLADRKRRRSMSPYDRERYDPRPRYGDDYGILLKLIFSLGFNNSLF